MIEIELWWHLRSGFKCFEENWRLKCVKKTNVFHPLSYLLIRYYHHGGRLLPPCLFVCSVIQNATSEKILSHCQVLYGVKLENQSFRVSFSLPRTSHFFILVWHPWSCISTLLVSPFMIFRIIQLFHFQSYQSN